MCASGGGRAPRSSVTMKGDNIQGLTRMTADLEALRKDPDHHRRPIPDHRITVCKRWVQYDRDSAALSAFSATDRQRAYDASATPGMTDVHVFGISYHVIMEAAPQYWQESRSF